MVTSINMGIIISNFTFHELSFRDDKMYVRKCYQVPTDDNQLIINMFDGHNYDKSYECYNYTYHYYNYKSYTYPYHFLNKDDVDQCQTRLQQLCNNKHIIFQLRSSVRGKFCVVIQCPTLISIKNVRDDVYNKLLLCTLCLGEMACYDVVTFIIKMLMKMEMIHHYVTSDPIYLRNGTDAYLSDNYKDFKSYVNDDHILINL